jgi:hypothetical protein
MHGCRTVVPDGGAGRWCRTVTPLCPFEESDTLLLFFMCLVVFVPFFYCLDILVTKKNMKNI